MSILPIENKSSSTLRLMIEPLAKEYDVEPGITVKISGNLENLQIDFGEDNFLALWVEGDVDLIKEGIVVQPLGSQV